jgi:hypothetical protein
VAQISIDDEIGTALERSCWDISRKCLVLTWRHYRRAPTEVDFVTYLDKHPIGAKLEYVDIGASYGVDDFESHMVELFFVQ